MLDVFHGPSSPRILRASLVSPGLARGTEGTPQAHPDRTRERFRWFAAGQCVGCVLFSLARCEASRPKSPANCAVGMFVVAVHCLRVGQAPAIRCRVSNANENGVNGLRCDPVRWHAHHRPFMMPTASCNKGMGYPFAEMRLVKLIGDEEQLGGGPPP